MQLQFNGNGTLAFYSPSILLSSCANEIDALSEEHLLLIERYPRSQKGQLIRQNLATYFPPCPCTQLQSLQRATGKREEGLDAAATITASQSALSLCRRRYCCLRPWPSPMQYCKEGRGRKGEPLSPPSVTRSRFHLCKAEALMVGGPLGRSATIICFPAG